MRLPKLKKGVSGFTLVEMAIVLVIIGIILAGVMKGRDIVRGAQVKQFSQQFAQKWATVAQTYYDKTGQQLNDGTINGGDGAAPDGMMDDDMPARAFDGVGGGILELLDGVGITACTLVKSKMTNAVPGAFPGAGVVDNHCGIVNTTNVMQNTVDGEFAGAQIVTVDLVGRRVNMNGTSFQRNMVVLYRVPQDVARGLDTAIDGRENGQVGSCINLGAAAGAAGAVGYAPGANGTFVNNGVAGDWFAKNWGTADSATLGITTMAIVLDY